MTAAPILWSFRRCPYAMRARMALAAAGITCELREILLGKKPDAFLETSAKGTVPVLVLPDGRIVDESLDVMHWALAQADPEGWLDCDLNEANELIAQNDGAFKHHLDRYKYPSRYDDANSDAHFDQAMEDLKAWDTRLDGQTGLTGGATRLADIAIFPFVRQFVAVDRARVEAAGAPRLLAWLDRHLASDRFKQIMTKHDLWVGGNGPLVFSPKPDHKPSLAGAAGDIGV